MSQPNIEITARGDISYHARTQAREKLGSLERFVNGPILGVRAVLSVERNPRIAAPAHAEAEVDLQGRMIRAHAEATTIEAAIDEVMERLQRQLRAYIDRIVTKKRAAASDSAA